MLSKKNVRNLFLGIVDIGEKRTEFFSCCQKTYEIYFHIDKTYGFICILKQKKLTKSFLTSRQQPFDIVRKLNLKNVPFLVRYFLMVLTHLFLVFKKRTD